MILNKRYLRNVKENLSFYVAAAVLTVVALLLFYLFYIAGTGIKSYGDQFFIDNKLEDATFTTYVEIPDNEITNIEKKYNVTFEKEHYVNINEDGYKVRVFKRNKKIDLYEVIDGNDISNDDEIVISKGYAESEHVSIGDRLTIKGKEYKVTGYFLRPDYLYMLENTDDSYKNITSFFLAYMTDSAYDALEANSCQYKIVYSDDSDVTQFRKDMNEQYKINSYLAKDNNQRITMVDDQSIMFLIMAFVFLFTLPLITVALIAIIIGRKIKQEQKMIGTLSALGYTKSQLMQHYSVLAMIPGLAGGIIVTIITKIIQQPYGELSLADYEPMPVKFTLPIPIALIGIIIPTAIYMLEAAHKVSKLLKKDTVEMLNGNADGDSMGSFKYEYVLNRLKTDEVAGADELVIGKYEHNGSAFSLIGADTDVKYLNIDTEDGSRADISNGYYVTNVMAYAYKLEAGDEFTFVNPVTMEEKKVTISGIIMNDSQKMIVCSQDNARKLLGWNDGTYNGLLSEKKLDLGDEISKTVTSDDIREQMQTILTEMGAIIYSLAVIGAIICIAALYVSVNMLISENRHNISMLKVLGLKRREINRMIIDVNHVIIPIGIAVGMLAGYLMMVVVFRIYSGIEGVLYTPAITFKSIILTIIIVLVCYAVSLLIVRRKADRVDMVESLNDNRE